MLDIYMVIMYGLMDTNFLDFLIFPLCVSGKKVIMVKILPPIPEILDALPKHECYQEG